MSALPLWRASIALHARGRRRLARVCKAINFLIFRALLEPEVRLEGSVTLAHAGTGVVIHATTTIEPDVVIWQDVLIASQTDKAIPGAGRDHGVIVGAGTVIGARAIVLCPAGRTLRIGRGARIGAGAVVIDDVPDGGVIGAAPSPLLRIEEQG